MCKLEDNDKKRDIQFHRTSSDPKRSEHRTRSMSGCGRTSSNEAFLREGMWASSSVTSDQVQLETRTDIPKSPERPCIPWLQQKPALLSTMKVTRSWNDVMWTEGLPDDERRNSEIVTSSLVAYTMQRPEAVLVRTLSVGVTAPAYAHWRPADSSFSHSGLSRTNTVGWSS